MGKNEFDYEYHPGAALFHEWRIKLELLDIPFKGLNFTSCNNRDVIKRVYERQDRAYGSKDWFLNFPNSGIKNLPIQNFDHARIEFDTTLTKDKRKRPYKMDAWY